LHSAALCIQLLNILRKWFATTVLTLHTCPATSYNFVRNFCNDSDAILSRISALCPGDQTFPSETYLKQLTNHIHLVKMIQNIKWLWQIFASERVEAAYIARTIFVIYGYLKSCVWLLLVAVTLPVTSTSWERNFSKWN